MAVEQYSEADKVRRRRASDLESGDQEVTWRDFMVDISGLWDGDDQGAEVSLKPRKPARMISTEENAAFWRKCDEIAGQGREPDWEEHLKTINGSRMRGLPEV